MIAGVVKAFQTLSTGAFTSMDCDTERSWRMVFAVLILLIFIEVNSKKTKTA